jgi:hypothetical protein
LLHGVVAKLNELSAISVAQAEARKDGDTYRATELDKKLDLLYGEKERAVGAWQEHVREHGC